MRDPHPRGLDRATLGRLAAVLVGVVVAVVASATPASAHNVLRSTAPADQQTVAAVPTAIVLTFNEPAIAMGTQIVVTGPSGEIQSGPPELVDSSVSQPLSPGAPAGAYTVTWRVTSIDGHPISGTYAFTATAAGSGEPLPSVVPTPAPIPGSSPPLGLGLLVGAVVLVAAAVVVRQVLGRGSAPPASDEQSLNPENPENPNPQTPNPQTPNPQAPGPQP